MSLVSIIIPVYNPRKHFIPCLWSVLNQSHTELDVIVINDGSEDLSASLVELINDDRIRLISNDKKGASSARN